MNAIQPSAGMLFPDTGKKAKPSPRSRPLLDAIVVACGMAPQNMTDRDWKRVQMAAVILESAEKPYTPLEVETFAQHYPKLGWTVPGKYPTPEILAKHIGKVRIEGSFQGFTPGGGRDEQLGKLAPEVGL